MIFRWSILVILLCAPIIVQSAATVVPEQDKGLYYLATPERGKTEMHIGFGNNNGISIMGITACKQGCPVAVYQYQQEPSETLGVPVFFNSSGLYVIRYDAESFIVVQPDGLLGRKVWSRTGHINLYSKNKTTVTGTSREQLVGYAMDLSKRIMNQEVGSMAHAAGTYFLAVPSKFAGKPTSEYQITFIPEGEKRLSVEPCPGCGPVVYKLLPDESAILGVDVYRYASSDYLFDIGDGVLIYTFANAGGLGKDLWGKNSHYNVISNNRAYVRQVLSKKDKQDAIDQLMSKYFAKVKTAFEERAKAAAAARTAKRELPAPGMQDSKLRPELLKAAKRWASNWQWKETLNDAYWTSADWTITRHPLTGIITGRNSYGIVTMKHPDGRCRFQMMGFRQQHDGSAFVNLHTSGVGPVYDIGCEKLL